MPSCTKLATCTEVCSRFRNFRFFCPAERALKGNPYRSLEGTHEGSLKGSRKNQCWWSYGIILYHTPKPHSIHPGPDACLLKEQCLEAIKREVFSATGCHRTLIATRVGALKKAFKYLRAGFIARPKAQQS